MTVDVQCHLDQQILPGAALAYARRGFKVFPLAPGTKEPLKRLAPHAYLSATTDESTIARWWTEVPEANIGIACVDGLIVIDLDRHEGKPDGVVAWQQIAGEHPPIQTLTQTTGGNGLHLLFWNPPGMFTTGRKRGTVLEGVGGIDIKVYSYIVASPSVVDGNMYRWANDLEIATLPTWYYTRQRSVVPQEEATYCPRIIHEPTEIEAQALLLIGDVDPLALNGEPTLRLIIFGDPAETDQSNIIARICRGVAQVRFDPARLFDMLKDPGNIGGEGLRRRIEEYGEDSARLWLVRTMLWAHGCRAQVLADIGAMRAEADEYDWPRSVKFTGRNGEAQSVRGSTAKRVLMVGLDVATERVRLDPMLGVQIQLPKLTGIRSHHTTRKAVQALEWLGWWTPSQPDIDGPLTNAYRYTLAPDPVARLHPPHKVKTFHSEKSTKAPMFGQEQLSAVETVLEPHRGASGAYTANQRRAANVSTTTPTLDAHLTSPTHLEAKCR